MKPRTENVAAACFVQAGPALDKCMCGSLLRFHAHSKFACHPQAIRLKYFVEVVMSSAGQGDFVCLRTMCLRVYHRRSPWLSAFLRAHLDACWHTHTCPHVFTVTNSQTNLAEEREEVDVDVGIDVDVEADADVQEGVE